MLLPFILFFPPFRRSVVLTPIITSHIESNESNTSRCATSLYFKPVQLPIDENDVKQKENNEPSAGEPSEGVSKNSSNNTSKDTYAAQLRGRALVGRKVVLPHNITGCELIPIDASAMPEEGREEVSVRVGGREGEQGA